LYGVLYPCRRIISHFKQNKRGKIIIVSGGGATNPMPNITAYASSKAAVIRLMESLAHELKPYNIDVNAVAPGALATRLVDQVLNAGPDVVGSEFYDKNVAWKTKGATSPELGAELVYYLAGAESNGITGRLLSAQWDNWKNLSSHLNELNTSDIYCLRRIVPEDRKKDWN
jgi:3-oxoacyl-[acyl-carrier protein] reductase